LRGRAGLYSIIVVSLVLATRAGAQQATPPPTQQAQPPASPHPAPNANQQEPSPSQPAAPPDLAPQLPPFAAGETPRGPVPPLSTIASYAGLIVRDIQFKGPPERERDHLLQFVSQKVGQPLDREAIRHSIETLYAIGLFYDIQVEAEKTPENQVSLTFVLVLNYFIGTVDVVGTQGRPNSNQIISATKLQLGEIYTPEKLQRAQSSILQLMSDNGYYRASVTAEEHPRPNTSQIDITFHLTPGPIAHVGNVTVKGEAGFSQGQIQDIAKMHPGDRLTSDRVSNALQRIRKAYVKQNRLLVQVLISDKTYRPETNVVDFTFTIQPGPKVQILAQGYKIRKSTLQKRVPVYEENALDDDLLNEGRRNLLDYMQSKGYFDAKVGIKKETDESANELRAIFVIDPGQRFKLARIMFRGNKYFDVDALRTHMQVQPAT